MTPQFAARIASWFKYETRSHADIAKHFKINKNTVSRIKKIYREVRWHMPNENEMKKLTKKYHVSKSIIMAIHKESQNVY